MFTIILFVSFLSFCSSQSVFNKDFLKSNCYSSNRLETRCTEYHWQFPQDPICVPWDLSKCKKTYSLNRYCYRFDCKVRKNVNLLFVIIIYFCDCFNLNITRIYLIPNLIKMLYTNIWEYFLTNIVGTSIIVK